MRLTRTRLRISGALVLVAALALTVIGFAQQGSGGGGRGGRGGFGEGHGRHGGGNPLGPLARGLDLTDAQRTQIKQIMDGLQESTKGLHEQLRASGGSPFEGLKDGAFDEAAARSAAQARAATHVELEVARARAMSQVYALLTAEQKTKLAELRQQFEQRRQQGGAGRRGMEGVPQGR
ncbi:MAG TPA: Spy/CpxP family protein refolding chaperone [Pyrinomonadaceae bacterium]|nr:Spy/CpxP family protein refolding chaperone [Pyrinomonadaceae bacterium]